MACRRYAFDEDRFPLFHKDGRGTGRSGDCKPWLTVSWPPFPGQFGGWNKLGSGSRHAANLVRSGVPWQASSGVLPPSAE